MGQKKTRNIFDNSYYEKFYVNPQTRAVEEKDIVLLVNHICSYLRYLRIPVKSALDMGCGLGLWKKPLEDQFPGIAYTGVDSSSQLCARLGWKHSSITDYHTRKRFDLVICQSVLQYLPDNEINAALENIHSLCRGGMYLEVVTHEDWRTNCDQSRTDGKIHLRPAKWYRKKVGKYFSNCGGGLFLPAESQATMYEMERLRPLPT